IKANGTSELLTCCIRPTTIFGPGDNIISYVDYYGRTQVIIGDGKNHDDFVYVDNVVHCHVCAERALCTKEGAKISGGKVYFVTNMEQMNLWDFIYMVHEELGYKRPFQIRLPLFVILPISYVQEWTYKLLSRYGMRQAPITPARIKYLTLNRTFSCNKAVKELGYKPIVTLKVSF
ncbi:3beta-hydroxysteroid-dehydrogenase/decarboxylase isoform 1, partial [Dichanthelium oligosanthes]